MLYSITHPLNAWNERRHIRRRLAEIQSQASSETFPWTIRTSC